MSTKIIRNPAENCEILVSAQEEKYRKKIPSFEDTKDKLFKCTVCNVNLTPFIEAGKSCHLHSFLKVLVCKKCLDFYGDGYFSTDEDGDEKFCRWCGQGGKLFLCEKCNGGFCRACVKRNFNRAVFEDLKQQDNWDCFICDPKPLYELRAKAWVAEKHYLSLRKDDKKSKMKTTTPEEDEQKEKKSKECKSFRAEQKFIDTARKLLLESLDESIRLADQCKMQAEKIQKTKMSKKRVKDVEAIKSLESKLHVFFNSITENVEAIKFNLTKNLVDWQVLYDERFPKQTNGEGKTEENGCDEEEKKMDEEEEKVEDGEKVENGDVEDDEKDEVENGDEKDEDDAKKDEVKEEENDEPMETSLNETNQSESTTVHGADESIDADKSTIAEDSDCEEPASKIPKKT